MRALRSAIERPHQMRSTFIAVGICSLIAFLAASPKEGESIDTIGRTWGGAYIEVVIQRQQLAQRGGELPTFHNVGDPLIIENWVEEPTIPPGHDGRISSFRPPARILVQGHEYQVDEPMGEVRISTGEQTTKYVDITDQPTTGTPPDGYRWTGEIRIATRLERVTWRRDWRYVRPRPAKAEQNAAGQSATRPESK